ncbi:MAG: hypothetical protein ACEPOW_06460 [Bacteroidales bacterium]
MIKYIIEYPTMGDVLFDKPLNHYAGKIPPNGWATVEDFERDYLLDKKRQKLLKRQ